jgi:hypothetical protein
MLVAAMVYFRSLLNPWARRRSWASSATEFLIPFFKSKVRMLQQNLQDLKAQELGLFDVILFPGVLYHLRYPSGAKGPA